MCTSRPASTVRQYRDVADSADQHGSGSDLSTQFIFDKGVDEVKSRFGYETEGKAALRIEPLSPSPDDAGDGLVGFMPDQPDGLIASATSQRLDLVTDGAGNAGHVEVASRSNPGKIEHAGMDEEANRRARAREPVASIKWNRQDRFLSD
jgi:hypothetical protein